MTVEDEEEAALIDVELTRVGMVRHELLIVEN
jgi:hypothetical protein